MIIRDVKGREWIQVWLSRPDWAGKPDHCRCFLDDLKKKVPSRCREYNRQGKFWLVRILFKNAILQMATDNGIAVDESVGDDSKKARDRRDVGLHAGEQGL